MRWISNKHPNSKAKKSVILLIFLNHYYNIPNSFLKISKDFLRTVLTQPNIIAIKLFDFTHQPIQYSTDIRCVRWVTYLSSASLLG